MADEIELLEVEILEKKIQLLESDNQRLRSAFTELQSTNRRLLEENLRLGSSSSSVTVLRNQLESLQIDGHKALETKNEQIERLMWEVQEMERKNLDLETEAMRMRKEREGMLISAERLEDRMDRTAEDNTVVILTLLTTQSDLEADLEKQTAIIRGFFERTVGMVRRTAEMIEGGFLDGMDFWEPGSFGGGGGGGMDSTVEMMARSIEVELAGVKRAFRKKIFENKRDAGGEEDESISD